MNRRKFLGIATGTVAVIGAGSYLLSDRNNMGRESILKSEFTRSLLNPRKNKFYI